MDEDIMRALRQADAAARAGAPHNPQATLYGILSRIIMEQRATIRSLEGE